MAEKTTDIDDIYLDMLQQKLASSGEEREEDSVGEDEEMWDSMAVMASEQWNKGEADEMDVRNLIPNGHEVLTCSERSEVFLTAAQTGMIGLVKELYSLYGDSLIQYRDEDLYTALHRASYNGHVPVVEHLISVGADVNARTEDGWQPLHCACRWNKAEVASLLLQNGAVINSQTNGGQTALHLAASNDKAKATLELLLTSRDIDINVTNNAGETARSLAMSYGRLGYLFEMKEQCIDCRLND